MIEINLLPNARKKSRASSSAKFDFGAAMGGMTERFKDPWLGVAIGGMVVGLGLVGLMWFTQDRAMGALVEREQVAVQDSARFAAVVAQMQSAQAQRDSIERQIAVITAIDGDRFIWPHILDEVSRALPTYTWVSSLAAANPRAPQSPEAAVTNAPPPISVRLIGVTVDVQAVPIFMNALEASPFIQNVNIAVSEVAVVEGKQVAEFTLDFQFERPDKSVIRTVPLSVAVR
jgi:Tfp pilus assembly protein PilN